MHQIFVWTCENSRRSPPATKKVFLLASTQWSTAQGLTGMKKKKLPRHFGLNWPLTHTSRFRITCCLTQSSVYNPDCPMSRPLQSQSRKTSKQNCSLGKCPTVCCQPTGKMPCTVCQITSPALQVQALPFFPCHTVFTIEERREGLFK